MYCPNCGKELLEGQACDCTNAQVAPEQTFEEPVAQNYYEPVQNQQPAFVPPVYDPAQNPAFVAPAPSKDYPEGYKPKKKYVAVILAVALGEFGIHNFYLGNNGKAVAQLLISLIGSLFFGLGIVVTAVWALVEAIQLLTDKIDADANNYKIMTLAEEIAAAQKD